MDSSYVYSRAADSWKLSFLHAGKLLHFLARAFLMTIASACLLLAWLCCWIDRFRSNKSTAWIIPVAPASARQRRLQPERLPQPQTIDSLIRSKASRMKLEEPVE